MSVTKADLRALAWGIGGTFGLLLVVGLCFALWVGWTRAWQGQQAYACLGTPKCVSDVLRASQAPSRAIPEPPSK